MKTKARLLAPTVLLIAFVTVDRSRAAPGESREKVSEQQSKEYQVKAAFLYNFTKFVEWKGASSKSEESDQICIAGHHGRARVVIETLKPRPGLVRHVKAGEEIKGCFVLFQASGEKPIRENWAELTKGGVLVVTEEPAQLNRGSILNFYLADGKVRFEANIEAAKASGFRLNSQLLQLARIAKTEGGRE